MIAKHVACSKACPRKFLHLPQHFFKFSLYRSIENWFWFHKGKPDTCCGKNEYFGSDVRRVVKTELLALYNSLSVISAPQLAGHAIYLYKYLFS